MKYLSKTAVINAAQKSGSAAKTYNGAVKHLVKNAADPSELHERGKRATRHNRGEQEYALWLEGCRARTGDGRAKILGYSLEDANTPGRIQEMAREENRQWDEDCRSVIGRNEYGQVVKFLFSAAARPRPELAQWREARALLDEAIAVRAISQGAYDNISRDRRGRYDGDALHHELYDFAPDAILICLRATKGNRYGVKTTSKKYLLIERTHGITAAPTTLPVAKFAKLIDIAYGEIIARVRGEAGAILLPPTIEFEPAYKALAVDGEILRSVFSGEEYRLGTLKRQRARDEHEGGYYCYGSIEEALQAAVPEESKCLDLPRVIVRCEVAGRKVVYDSGKKSRTYLRPLEIVASRI